MGQDCGWVAAIAGILASLCGACAAAHQDRARQLYAQGRFDEAGYEIQAALANDPDNLAIRNLAAQIFTQQGVALYQGGDLIAAGIRFHRAIDYVSTYAPAYDYLGLIAFAEHDWEDAIRYGDQAAGYTGQPTPGYVAQARANLQKIRSGRLFDKRGNHSAATPPPARGNAG
jgi:tetratricopeptide (TPR) repeat protein